MDRAASRTAVIAAVAAFLIGLFESGLITEGLILSIEDLLHTGPDAHRVGMAIGAVLALAFSLYAARRAYRLAKNDPRFTQRERMS